MGSLHAAVEIQNILYYCKQYKHTSQCSFFIKPLVPNFMKICPVAAALIHTADEHTDMTKL